MPTADSNHEKWGISAMRKESQRHIAALVDADLEFDDVVTTDDAPLNPATLVKVRRGGIGGTGVGQ